MHVNPPAGAVGPGGLRLGRVFGVPILLSPSWWLGAAVITVLYVPMTRQLVPGLSTSVAVAMAMTLAVLLAASVLAHELGHCVAALRLGLPVRRVRLFLLGGISELARPPLRPRDEGVIAVAGPVVSIAVAAVAGGVWWLLEPGGLVWLLAVELTVANAAVAVFNLLPGLPLDGGRVLRAAVWSMTGRRGAGTRAAAIGGGIVVGGLVIWGLQALAAGAPAAWLRFAVIVLMAWFVLSGTSAELSRAQRPFGSVPPEQLDLPALVRPLLQLPAESPVADALAAAAGRSVLLVRADGVAAGLLEDGTAARLAARSPLAPAGRAAVPVAPEAVLLDSELDGDPAGVLERAQVAGAQFLVVDEDGRPSGVLRVDDIYTALAGHRPS
ncbi:MAG TPA: site-2 protease family protein [Pseudonocardiaceae bacterium]|nr:site-2 protease family protein [Pseudonocardiaceae bacterium]